MAGGSRSDGDGDEREDEGRPEIPNASWGRRRLLERAAELDIDDATERSDEELLDAIRSHRV